MNKDRMISEFSHALYEGYGMVFVGSGISYPSCQTDWFDLLSKFKDELGFDLNRDIDIDLPLIAQYIVNSKVGNRGPLINHIFALFGKERQINEYHRHLARCNLSTIWTTNYDTLIEQAFNRFDIHVKTADSTLSKSTSRQQVELIKMHGCVHSPHEDITITQEDYEDYFRNKPATAKRLENDLLNNSFLFIGYGCRDPNIKNILVEVRRLSCQATKQHFLIQKKEKAECALRRQELWCQDLERFGISTVFIDDYDEIVGILESISQKSRGNTVYCTGSHQDSNPMARELGAKLVRVDDIVLLSGQSSGIGSEVTASFTEQCIELKKDINHYLKIFPNPYAADPKYSNDKELIPELKKCRAKLLNSTQIVVVFDGRMGTEAEVEVAQASGCKIIPVPKGKSTFSRKMLKQEGITKYLETVAPDYLKRAKAGNIVTEDVIQCIKTILNC